jgi:hypothetical protein
MDVRMAGVSGLVPRENVLLPTVIIIFLGLLMIFPRLVIRRRWEP